MGIPGLNTFLRNQFPSAFSAVPRRRKGVVVPEHDILYVDVNNIIYTLNRRAKDEVHLRRLLFRKLRNVCNDYRPRELFLALDGPSPLAKLQTQRRRRYRGLNEVTADEEVPLESGADGDADVEESSAETSESDEAEENTLDIATRTSKKSSGAVNPLLFTPGVPLMTTMKNWLCWFAKLYVGEENNCETAYVSAADRGGEGEFKIFEHIHLRSDTPGGEGAGEGEEENGMRYVVVGTDSDLVVLSLLSKKPGITISMDFDGKRLNCSIDKLRSLIQSMACSPSEDDAIVDFAVMCLFNGNDYMPKVRNAQVKQLWRNYVALRKKGESAMMSLTWQDREATLHINTEVAQKWLQKCARSNSLVSEMAGTATGSDLHPVSALHAIVSHSDEYEKKKLFYEVEDIEDGFRVTYSLDDLALGTGTGSSKKNAKYAAAVESLEILGDMSSKNSWNASESSVDMAVEHLKAVTWLLHYFSSGKCLNYDYIYPFPIGPSVADIQSTLEEGLESTTVRGVDSKALAPVECLRVMMPRQRAMELLDPGLQQIFNEPITENEDAIRACENNWRRHPLAIKNECIRVVGQHLPSDLHELNKSKDAMAFTSQGTLRERVRSSIFYRPVWRKRMFSTTSTALEGRLPRFVVSAAHSVPGQGAARFRWGRAHVAAFSKSVSAVLRVLKR